MTKLKDIEIRGPKPASRASRLLKPLTLPVLYLVWAVLCTIGESLGLLAISTVSIVILLIGCFITNAYFVGVSHGKTDEKQFGDEIMPGVQSSIALVWIALFCHISFGAREFALGMYATILVFALFRLDSRKYNRLLIFTAATYWVAVGLRGVIDINAVDWVAETPAFLSLITLLIACHIFHIQFDAQQSYFAYRNYELQVILQRLTRIAKRDHLTRSYNRRYIMEALAREKSRADRAEGTFSVCILDLDHFKKLNDRFGHGIGDKVLLGFAKRIKSALRGMDSVNQSRFERSFGRFGGEEFIAVLPDTDAEGARHCAERLCKTIAAKPFLGEYDVTVSVGVATYTNKESIPELLSRADNALYEAKDLGRNQCRYAIEEAVQVSDDTLPEIKNS